MTRTELDQFQAMLAAKQAEVARAMGRREGITIERSPDALDETRFAAERELSSRGLERESKLLRRIRAALDRIAAGNYGACLECEEEISHKHLRAMPWASLCTSCQEHADRNPEAGLRPAEGYRVTHTLAPFNPPKLPRLSSPSTEFRFQSLYRVGGPRSIQFTEAPVLTLLSRQPRNGGGSC